jgi:2-methylcitrate dehydratase PrpD
MSLSDRIARHVHDVSFEALSADTRHATRRALLDALGVMLGATGLAEDPLPYLAYAEGSGEGPSRLLATGGKAQPATAALANGALGHALDFGDTFDRGPAHPSAALVPALLALADSDPSIDGGQFLAAMAAGSDLACRLSIAPARPYEEGGWYPPPLVGMIASAAACAKLIGLDADGIRHAMGLALLQGNFPAEIKYDTTSPLRGVREGLAARGAVEAALLARAGARAFAAPLEGRGGFFAIYGGGEATAALTEHLGTRFLGDEVSFKPWPCCRGTHAYIEAALALRETLDWREIASIEAETGPIQEMLIRPQSAKAAPGSSIEAKFSIPFTAACAFIHGQVGLDSFDTEARADADVLRVATLVGECRNPGWGREHAASGSLTVTLRSGERITHAVPHAMGDPARPISDEALVEKFVACAIRASDSIDTATARNMAAQVLALGAYSSASRLLART